MSKKLGIGVGVAALGLILLLTKKAKAAPSQVGPLPPSVVPTNPPIWPGHGYKAACDLNNDGFVDEADLAILRLSYNSVPGDPNWNPQADIDGNGQVSGGDMSLLNYWYYPNDGINKPFGS
jgi:hypothetical protein